MPQRTKLGGREIGLLAAFVLLTLILASFVISLTWSSEPKSAATLEQISISSSNIRDRTIDNSIIKEATIEVSGQMAVVTGVVINSESKTKDIGIWAGFVGERGFQDAGSARKYFGFQPCWEVAPQESCKFWVNFEMPADNNKWAIIAELDPAQNSGPPKWSP